MKKSNYYTHFFNTLSYYFTGEDRALFYKSKESLENYETCTITGEILNKVIEKQKGAMEKIICPDILLKIISIYVNHLFIMVHASVNFASKSDISDRYFSLLNVIEEFFILINKKFPDQMNESVWQAALKIILIFNAWGQVLGKNRSDTAYPGKVYARVAQQYFHDLYENDKPCDYHTFMFSTYKNLEKNTDVECLKATFAQLSQEYTPSSSSGYELFASASLPEIKEPLIKYKTS